MFSVCNMTESISEGPVFENSGKMSLRPRQTRLQFAVSKHSLAYWLFHTITIEQKGFSKIHKLKTEKNLY